MSGVNPVSIMRLLGLDMNSLTFTLTRKGRGQIHVSVGSKFTRAVDNSVTKFAPVLTTLGAQLVSTATCLIISLNLKNVTGYSE